jgi:hypothetical protein
VFFKSADGRAFIFFEEYVYSRKKAHLSVLEIAKDVPFFQTTNNFRKALSLVLPFYSYRRLVIFT